LQFQFLGDFIFSPFLIPLVSSFKSVFLVCKILFLSCFCGFVVCRPIQTHIYSQKILILIYLASYIVLDDEDRGHK
jgi:hypothetical protein